MNIPKELIDTIVDQLEQKAETIKNKILEAESTGKNNDEKMDIVANALIDDVIMTVVKYFDLPGPDFIIDPLIQKALHKLVPYAKRLVQTVFNLMKEKFDI